MNKQPLNYIFINPNESEDKKKRFQEKVIKVFAISTCKKFIEEMEKVKWQMPKQKQMLIALRIIELSIIVIYYYIIHSAHFYLTTEQR